MDRCANTEALNKYEEEMARNEEEWDSICEEFNDRFGETITEMRTFANEKDEDLDMLMGEV